MYAPDIKKHVKKDKKFYKELLSSLAITQRECCELTGVAPRTLAYYLAGKNVPYSFQYMLESLIELKRSAVL